MGLLFQLLLQGRLRQLALLLIFVARVQCFTSPLYVRHSSLRSQLHSLSAESSAASDVHSHVEVSESGSRRTVLQGAAAATIGLWSSPLSIITAPPMAAAAEPIAPSTESATITEKVYFLVKGLPSKDPSVPSEPRKIVVGLFGRDAPQSAGKIQKLLSREGLPVNCQPKAERTLQKEQLEANKVYNSCIEGIKDGVTLQYSSIWRVVPNQRIDLGAVSGKFVAREFPDWQESSSNTLQHDAPGVVSVRRGSDSGFGFTIFTGGLNGDDDNAAKDAAANRLNAEHIVIGRVLEGMDVVRDLNAVPVINSASQVNYMGLTGGTTTKNAPDRSCRYGGNMYCNENKPLIKLSITDAGTAR